MDEILYVVQLKPETLLNSFRIKDTTLRYGFFAGRLVKSVKDYCIFKINGSDALVKIPLEWIEFMAPGWRDWEKRGHNEQN